MNSYHYTGGSNSANYRYENEVLKMSAAFPISDEALADMVTGPLIPLPKEKVPKPKVMPSLAKEEAWLRGRVEEISWKEAA